MAAADEDKPWYQSVLEWFLGDSEGDARKKNAATMEHLTVANRFTKLSSFKFRRELGKGAFGRVLLAESKADGSLYALKIISKKNMRCTTDRLTRGMSCVRN